MGSKQKWIGLSVAFTCLAFFAAIFLNRIFVIHPSAETESTFLRNYDPRPEAAMFELKTRGAQWSNHNSSAAGRKFASHQRAFYGQLSIDPKNWMPLMNSLALDLSAQLSHYGAEILGQSGDPRHGFRFDYKIGKTLGSAVISPLSIGAGQPVPTGELQVGLDVSIDEKWFPRAPGLITVRVSDQIR